MNIFNRRNDLDRDDLPGAREMPRAKLPVEEQVADLIHDQYQRRPKAPTPASLAVELETNASSFELAVTDAEAAAKAYCQTYAELEAIVSSELEAIEAKRLELRKLQASLPRVERPDAEDMETHGTVTGRLPGTTHDNPVTGKDPVPLKSIQGLSKPLSPDRR